MPILLFYIPSATKLRPDPMPLFTALHELSSHYQIIVNPRKDFIELGEAMVNKENTVQTAPHCTTLFSVVLLSLLDIKFKNEFDFSSLI